jgi:diguanylate cyclase (GGDEF)-like protein/PAS domain S-box-containing protein
MVIPKKIARLSGTTVTSRVWRLFGIAACALVILMVSVLVGLERAKANRAAIARTAVIQRNLGALGEDLLNAETGQRGFLLTQDDKYLAPYVVGVKDAKIRLAALAALMTDPAERSLLDKMAPVVADKFAELAHTIDLAETGRRDAAMNLVMGGTGKRLMDDFRSMRDAAIDGGQRRLEEQRVRANDSISLVALILLFGGGSTLAMLYYSTRRTTRQLGRPIHDLVDAMLAVALGSTDRRVAVVARDEIGAMSSAFNTMTQRLAISRQSEEDAKLELLISHEAIRESEVALRQSEQHLHTLVDRLQLVTDNIPGLICQLDREFRYRFLNRTYADWFHIDPAAWIGKSIQEIHGHATFKSVERKLELALSGTTVTDEREIAVDGVIRHCQVVMVPQATDRGEITGLFVIHTDITDRRHAELALRESQSFLARTGATAGVGGWELNLVNNTVTWSDETRRLHEVDADFRPTVEDALRFYTPKSQSFIEDAVANCIDSATPWDLELEMISAKGRSFWARSTGSVEVENGQPVRLVGAFQDVTERRRLERELAESYELVRVTLDSIGDAVITTDQQGRVQWLNPVAEAMTGWRKEDAHMKPLAEVFHILQAETRQIIINPIAVCLAEGRTVGLQSHTTLVARDGREYGIEDSASPIRNAEGQVLGAVLVFHDVTEQRRLSREMSHRAAHDSLTGLINRAEFETRLSRLLANATLEGGMHVLMYIDLDEFKIVNDACGHSAGDQLLRQVSALFQGSMRGRDTVARLGGDEFGVILENCSIEHGQLIAGKICEQMESYRFAHDGRRYRIGTSIGVVPVDVRWASSAAVMQAADSCCYAAKDAGRNRVHLWVESDSAMQVRQGEMQWVNRLEAAMDENRFVLFAQHIELIDGGATGLHCEVLLRLRDDDGSLIQPGAFFPAAERFHLASRIDKWVIHHVFDLLRAPQTLLDRIETVAINLSGQSIGDRAFHRALIKLIREAPFDVRKLCFEITETAAITNLGDARLFIEEIRSLGVRIALDDFGAGASSFGYLRMLPVDYLKIDGQFITRLLDDPLDHAAVRCFCEVAKVVGVRTIAEFVERADVRAELLKLGVDMAQGYLIHRPEPLAPLLPQRQAVDVASG